MRGLNQTALRGGKREIMETAKEIPVQNAEPWKVTWPNGTQEGGYKYFNTEKEARKFYAEKCNEGKAQLRTNGPDRHEGTKHLKEKVIDSNF